MGPIRLYQRNSILIGLTLIECMLALLLSSIIFSGILTLALTLKKNMALQMAWMSIQDNSRTSMQLLQHAIRAAGYRGCSSLPIGSVEPYHHPNGDGITIRSVDTANVTLINTMSDNHTLHLTGSTTFKNTDNLVITDCTTTEMFNMRSQSTKSDGSTMVLTEEPLNHRYPIHSEVSRLRVDSYYIAKTTRENANGTPVYALYHEDSHARKSELVEGVDDMKILYGVVENDRLEEYPSDKLLSQHQIVTVTLQLTVSSFPLIKTGFTTIALRN